MSLRFHQAIIFISGYIVFGLSIGFLFSLGTIFPMIMDTFNSTRAETSLIQSIYAAFLNVGGIAWGNIVSKFGPQKTAMFGSLVTSVAFMVSYWSTSLQYLIVTSVFAACGLGMSFVSCTVGVRKFFAGKSSKIAVSLMWSTSGSTSVAFTYIFRYLSDMYGLRGMLLIIGGLQLHGAVSSLLWKQCYVEKNNFSGSDTLSKESSNTESMSTSNKEQRNNQDICVNDGYISTKGQNCKGINSVTSAEGIGKNSDAMEHRDIRQNMSNNICLKAKLKYLLNNQCYIFTVIALVCCLNPLMQYIVFLLDMYEDRGFSRLQGSNGLTIMNIASIFGRASPAIITKCKFYNEFLLPVSSNALASIAMSLLTVFNNVAFYNILVVLIGFGLGVCASVLVVIVAELVEPKYLAEAVGLIMTINGVCALFRSALTGYLRDLTGSYTLPQILTSMFTAFGSVMFIAAAYFQRKKNKNIEKNGRSSIFYVTKL